jgi:hypothetical protein
VSNRRKPALSADGALTSVATVLIACDSLEAVAAVAYAAIKARSRYVEAGVRVTTLRFDIARMVGNFALAIGEMKLVWSRQGSLAKSPRPAGLRCRVRTRL